MAGSWNDILWAQFDAAITTLGNAIEACPQAVWSQPAGPGPFWRAAFHAIFWLDAYAGESQAAYRPPEGFTPWEFDEHGEPPRVYGREELLAYLECTRDKCRQQVMSLSAHDLERPSGFEWLSRRGMGVAETVVYNLRHVQHHAAQLNLILRQAADHGAPWVHRGS